MGLFKKDSKKNNKDISKYNYDSEVPKLPELPKLPEFPGMENETPKMEEEKFSLPQLPSFPNSSFGDKFSQNTIKEAVSGGKEVDSEVDANDWDVDEEMPMMQSPSDKMEKSVMSRNMTNPMQPQVHMPSYTKQYTSQRKPEPIFIRLDKFEESLEIFKNAKEQISEIEHLLKEIKELKTKEEEELSDWENEIQDIKNQIEKVDQDIFSKV